MRIARNGIAADLPPGWEGAIGTAAPDDTGKSAAAPLPVLHLCTAALAPDRGDFGSGAVEGLGPDDAFIALLEYGSECVGTALYAHEGLPRRLRAKAFNRRALQRTIAGQAGMQRFFTDGGRAFCLYVVLGRDHDLAPLLARVHAALDGIDLTR
jgi:hypothetical protein